MRKTFLNTLYFICSLYIFGIAGSLELGRLSPSQSMKHIAAALIFTAAVYVALHLAIIARALLARYRYNKRKRATPFAAAYTLKSAA